MTRRRNCAHARNGAEPLERTIEKGRPVCRAVVRTRQGDVEHYKPFTIETGAKLFEGHRARHD